MNETKVRLTPAQAKAEGILRESIDNGLKIIQKQIEDQEAEYLEYQKKKHLAFGYTCPGCGYVFEDMIPPDEATTPIPGDKLMCSGCSTKVKVLEVTNGILTVKKIPKKGNKDKNE